MLKSIGRYVLIVFGIVTLCASTSREAMEIVSQKRAVKKWWGTYDWLHGDLVGMSCLDFVGKFRSSEEYVVERTYSGTGNIVLYLQGDSYARHAHLNDSDFSGVSSFRFADREQRLCFHLDTGKKNILIIEISERFVRKYFAGLKMLHYFNDSMIIKKEMVPASTTNASGTQGLLLSHFSIDRLFNKFINQNLECNLFNYNFMMPLFQCKAALNYCIFSRASGDVVISNDRRYLFFKETIDPCSDGSSFSPLSVAEGKNIIANLNVLYTDYKSCGFSEVYLSIIPSPVTILQPDGYNGLITGIQNDPGLRMKVIDVFTTFKKANEALYLAGDTHWNNAGFRLWLELVNKQLFGIKDGGKPKDSQQSVFINK